MFTAKAIRKELNIVKLALQHTSGVLTEYGEVLAVLDKLDIDTLRNAHTEKIMTRYAFLAL